MILHKKKQQKNVCILFSVLSSSGRAEIVTPALAVLPTAYAQFEVKQQIVSVLKVYIDDAVIN